MHVESVEIYSDETNAAVIRHPSRRFPGLLLQGDTLYALCHRADLLCEDAKEQLTPTLYNELNAHRNALWSLLTH